VQHEALGGLDRSAIMHAQLFGEPMRLDVELLEQLLEGERAEHAVDDDPHRPVLGVDA
jgi:hypothetical protein